MPKSRMITMAVAIILTFLFCVGQAVAETMKFRVLLHHKKIETSEVGDAEGHIIGIYESSGLASLQTGEIAVIKLRGTFDYIKGSGMHTAYAHLEFEDGSSIDYQYEGTTEVGPEGKGAIFKNKTLKITNGSGRYTGIRGSGSFIGRRLVTLGAGAELYSDSTLTYTLP